MRADGTELPVEISIARVMRVEQGFLALADGSEVLYKATDYWHAASERTIWTKGK